MRVLTFITASAAVVSSAVAQFSPVHWIQSPSDWKLTSSATSCGTTWGLKAEHGAPTPGYYYTWNEVTTYDQAYFEPGGNHLWGHSGNDYSNKNIYLLYKPKNGSGKRWESSGSSSEDNIVPSRLKKGLSIWKAWEDAGVSGGHQEKIAFQVLSLPKKEDVEYLVIVSAGTQQAPPGQGWHGNAAALTGQMPGYHDDFGNTGTMSSQPVWTGGLAHKILTSTEGFPMHKTLFINIFDNAWPLIDLSFDEKQDNMLGWYNFINNFIESNSDGKWGKLKGVMLAGMSRGGCWVSRFLGHYIKFKVPSTTKFILETNDPVCDTKSDGKDWEALDSSSLPVQNGASSWSVSANAKVQNDDESANPSTWLPGASPGDFKCKHADLDNFVTTDKTRFCWHNTVGGQKVGNDQHRGFCHKNTPDNADSVSWFPYLPDNTPNDATLQLLDSNNDIWYKQRWVPWSHCIIGRSGYQTKLPNTHFHHYKSCVARFRLNEQTGSDGNTKPTEHESSPVDDFDRINDQYSGEGIYTPAGGFDDGKSDAWDSVEVSTDLPDDSINRSKLNPYVKLQNDYIR